MLEPQAVGEVFRLSTEEAQLVHAFRASGKLKSVVLNFTRQAAIEHRKSLPYNVFPLVIK